MRRFYTLACVKAFIIFVPEISPAAFCIFVIFALYPTFYGTGRGGVSDKTRICFNPSLKRPSPLIRNRSLTTPRVPLLRTIAEDDRAKSGRERLEAPDARIEAKAQAAGKKG